MARSRCENQILFGRARVARAARGTRRRRKINANRAAFVILSSKMKILARLRLAVLDARVQPRQWKRSPPSNGTMTIVKEERHEFRGRGDLKTGFERRSHHRV